MFSTVSRTSRESLPHRMKDVIPKSERISITPASAKRKPKLTKPKLSSFEGSSHNECGGKIMDGGGKPCKQCNIDAVGKVKKEPRKRAPSRGRPGPIVPSSGGPSARTRARRPFELPANYSMSD